MPTWGGILKELNATKPPQFDAIRRKYLFELSAYTKRDAILYSTKFASPGQGIAPDQLSVNDEDLQGFMEVIHGLRNTDLDLIIHSPGGSLEAAEALVSYLRSMFSNIRVIVPSLAMSAATMIACASNRIVMGKHSFLGPIDPQFIFTTPLGQRMVSAEAIMEQFDMARKECKDAANLGAWIPMLSGFGPDVLIKCQNACHMSKNLVQGWLEHFMFSGDPAGKKKAAKISGWLSKHKHFKSHGRHIPRAELIAKGLIIDKLEEDAKLEDLVLSVFHATNHTFNGTAAVKIIENNNGHTFLKQVNVNMNIPIQIPGMQIPFKLPPGALNPVPVPPPPAAPPQQP